MLTMEELTLIRIYKDLTQSRQTIIEVLRSILPHFSEDELEMQAMTQSVLRKLMAMNDQAFDAMDFSETLSQKDDEAAEA